jgi:predicted nucleic acid-binding protein
VIIVDTTVWVDYLRGGQTPQTAWLDDHLLRERLGLTDLILCEVLQGVTNNKAFEEVRRQLFNFEILPMGGVNLAVTAAANYRTLRSRGRTVRRTIDSLIATYCLIEGHSLLHNDRDYDPFEELLGLSVTHP